MWGLLLRGPGWGDGGWGGGEGLTQWWVVDLSRELPLSPPKGRLQGTLMPAGRGDNPPSPPQRPLYNRITCVGLDTITENLVSALPSARGKDTSRPRTSP